MLKQLQLEERLQPAFESDFVSISLDLENLLLVVCWRRQISLNERKIGFMQGVSLTKKHGLKYWLVDDRKLSIITQPEKDWVLSEFQSEASQTSIRRLAVVIADFYPSLMANTEFTAKGKEGYKKKGEIEHEVLPDIDSAIDWLLTGEEGDTPED